MHEGQIDGAVGFVFVLQHSLTHSTINFVCACHLIVANQVNITF